MIFNGGYSMYQQNVRRTACMLATGDDWCSACAGAACLSCFPRADAGGSSAPITLHAASGKVRAAVA